MLKGARFPAALVLPLVTGMMLLGACGSGGGSAPPPTASKKPPSSVAGKGSPSTTPGATPAAGSPSPASAGPTLPTIPAPVAVKLDPKTTAYLILDDTSVICSPRPSCVATLPAVASLLKKARAAGVFVAYSQTPTKGSKIRPEIAPTAGEPVVAAHADKFYGTKLASYLQQHGIKTVVMVGTVANGAVMYTAFDANEHGYTVVVPVDGISAAPFPTLLAKYQLLNQPGYANPQNKPLQKDAVTLTTTGQVSFG